VLDELEAAVQRLGPGSTSEEFTSVALLRVETGRWLVEHAGPEHRYTPTQDAFEGTDGLPEIRRVDLDADHLASGLLFHGAMVVREFMTPAEVAVLRAHLDEQVEGAAARAAQGPPDPAEVEEWRRLGFPHLSARAQADLLPIYHRDGFAQILRQYLGGPAVMGTGRMALVRDERGPGLPWHQDAAYFLGECAAVNSWCALTPVGEDAPGVQVVPRRFREVVGFPSDALSKLDEAPDLAYSHGFPEDLIGDILAETPPVVPVLQPGDAMLFDEMTLHQTDRRHWAVPYREKAICWFFAPSRFSSVYTPSAL
jgi:ectoine hydroxylase-related dioxygenase (phytanoyl-CoA dioxygenase family)